MTNILNIIKLFLLLILVGLNIYVYDQVISFYGIKHLLYVVILGIFLFLSVKDLKNNANIIHNNKYNLLCIFTLLIIIAIFIRALYDPLFFFNNSSFMNNLADYQKQLYGQVYNIGEEVIIDGYITQNLNWFFILISLLLGYRYLNKK